ISIEVLEAHAIAVELEDVGIDVVAIATEPGAQHTVLDEEAQHRVRLRIAIETGELRVPLFFRGRRNGRNEEIADLPDDRSGRRIAAIAEQRDRDFLLRKSRQ